MARRKRRKSTGWRKGTCKVRKGRCMCKLKNGRVKFARRSRCRR